jgi:hypothetical protein
LIRPLAAHSYKGYALNMIAAAAACALLLAAPVSAAPSKPAKSRVQPALHRKPRSHRKPRPLTWETLAERVIKDGVDHPLRAPLSRNLGYDADIVPTRAVRYVSGHTPDGLEYEIFVIVKTSKDRTEKPSEIVVDGTQVETKSKGRYLSGYDIRFTPDGRILDAMKASGYLGQVVQSRLSPSDPFVRATFANLTNVLLVKMAEIPFDK